MKINIGCMDEKLDDYVSVDINPDTNPDIIDDGITLETIDDNSIDEIRAHNMLEHVPQIDIIKTLTTWHNKLKSGGKIDILVPNLKMFCSLYLKGVIKEPWAFSALYSSHKSRTVSDWHCSGFSKQYLYKILKEIGFINIKINDESLNCELFCTAFKK